MATSRFKCAQCGATMQYVDMAELHEKRRPGHEVFEQARESAEPTPAERLVEIVTERGDEYVRNEIRKRRTSPGLRDGEDDGDR